MLKIPDRNIFHMPIASGKPSLHSLTKHLFADRKISSTNAKDRYPIPSFLENRFASKNYDPI